MNRQLEILSRYLPYEVEVETWSGTRGVLESLDFADNEHPISVYTKPGQMITDGAKPILYGFSDLTKTHKDAEGNEFVPAVEIAKLAWADETIKINNELFIGPGYVIVYSKCDEYSVSIFEEWDVCVTEKDKSGETYDGFVENQALIQQKLLSWHFAVNLEETEYIRKEVAQ